MVKKVNGVVDRISEGEYAIILVEDIKEEFTVNVKTINVTLREGLWLDLLIDDEGNITEVKPNETLTNEKKKKVSSVMDRLRKRKGSKYKL